MKGNEVLKIRICSCFRQKHKLYVVIVFIGIYKTLKMFKTGSEMHILRYFYKLAYF